jgi:hypothetical protein
MDASPNGAERDRSLEGFARTASVDERTRLSYGDFRDYLAAARPVLIHDAFPRWKALERWTPEFFRTEHGHRTVTVAGEETTLGAYIDRVLSATPERPVPYLREVCIRDLAPELGEDLAPFVDYALPNWLRGNYLQGDLHRTLNRAAEVELFIGGAGTILERRRGKEDAGYDGLQGARIEGFVDLHFDPTACPVLLCQIYGEKEFTLFAPEDTPFLYATGRHSAVDRLHPPDFERFPLLRKATPYRFVQRPGDAIYVPPFWWHATRMRSVSIAIGSTFANAVHWPGVIADLMRDFGGGTVKAKLLRKYLEAEGVRKRLLGDRLGEESNFQTPASRRAYDSARARAKHARAVLRRR